MRRIAAGVVVLVCALSMLPGCGGVDVFRPIEPDHVLVVLGAPPISNDPVNCVDDLTDTVLVNVYQWVFDPAAPPCYSVCRSWTNPDPTTWDLKVTEGFRFHDGTPVRAEDVAASVRAVIEDERSPWRAFVSGIIDVSVPEAGIVRLRTAGPSDLRRILPRLAVFPRGRRPARGTAPVGSGPYRVAVWDPGRRIVLRRWESAGSAGGPEEVVVLPVRTTKRQLRMLLTASPALGTSLDRSLPDRAVREGLTVISSPGSSAWYVVCNLRPGAVTASLPVRRAIAGSLDGEAFCRATASRDTPLDDMVPRSVLGWRAGRYRPVRKWTESVPDPRPALRFVAMTTMGHAARLVAEQLRSQGWPVRLELLPIRRTLEVLRGGGWDVSLMGFTFQTRDALELYEFAFGTEVGSGGGNLSLYRDPGTDALLRAAGSSVDSAGRLQVLQELGDRLVDHLPWIPLAVTDRWAVVHGIAVSGGGVPQRWWFTRLEVGG